MIKPSTDASRPHASGAKAASIASPCLSVCRMSGPLPWREGADAKLKRHVGSSYCVGCARTIEEIAAWAEAPDEAKRMVWQNLPERRYALRELEGS